MRFLSVSRRLFMAPFSAVTIDGCERQNGNVIASFRHLCLKRQTALSLPLSSNDFISHFSLSLISSVGRSMEFSYETCAIDAIVMKHIGLESF